MTTTISDRKSLATHHVMIADLIERLGFGWTFHTDHPLPDQSKRLQIRNEAHYNPTQKVAELRAALKRGDSVPAIVVTKDGVLVDGNTRSTAAERNGFPTLPTFVLDVNYGGCTDKEERRLWALGAASNAGQSKGLDRQELRDAVVLIGEDPNYTATRIAALLKVTESTVNSILSEEKAHRRAEKLGVNLNGSLGVTQLRALGRSSDTLNDGPFRELASLAQESGMKGNEITALAKRAKAEKSDPGASKVIAAERESRREQIAEYTASGKSVPPNAAKLRQRLGFINSYRGAERDLVEHNDNLAAEHCAHIERAITVLQSVLVAQGR